MPGPTTEKSPFGVMLTAMVTPVPRRRLARPRRRAAAGRAPGRRPGHDGLVVNGTTGESPTKTDAEDIAVLRAVLEAVGDRATSSRASAPTTPRTPSRLPRRPPKRRRARRHGRHARTTTGRRRRGSSAHFHAIADATDLPMLTTTSPKRTGMRDRARDDGPHRRAPADRRQQGRQGRPRRSRSGAWPRTDLAWYSRRRHPQPAAAAARRRRLVSVVGHLVGDRLDGRWPRRCGPVDADEAARHQRRAAARLHRLFRTQGVILTKAALRSSGPARPGRCACRSSTPPTTSVAMLRADLADGGVRGFTA